MRAGGSARTQSSGAGTGWTGVAGAAKNSLSGSRIHGMGGKYNGPGSLRGRFWDRDYFTVRTKCIPSAWWGVQKPLYVPVGRPANDTS